MRAILAVFLGFLIASAAAHDASSWRKFDVPVGGTFRVTDANGVERDIAPGCSGGPVCAIDPSTGIPRCREGNKQFSFYYKPGKSDKVLVYFDGGGACWDSNTCVTGNQTPLSAYVPEIGPSSDPASKGGLFNLDNHDNPYREWSMVVLPYCTGDIHWGSNDASYTDFTGAVTGTPGGQVTIHHRGFDNFLFVRQWMKKRFDGLTDDGGKLLVTGSSAGAYGAAFSFPHLKRAFPRAKGYLMADAGNGVITDGFLDQAVDGLNPTWNIRPNLASWIPGMDSLPAAPADRYYLAYYFALAGYYPKDRFSQYTTHWDTIQALFYNIMLNQNNIPAWGMLTPEVYGAWVQQGLGNMFATAANPNYRFFVGEGCNHTLLRFDDDFYKTSANHPVQFLDWFKALTRERDDAAWQNTFCMNCSLPPTQPEVGACLARSFSQ